MAGIPSGQSKAVVVGGFHSQKKKLSNFAVEQHLSLGSPLKSETIKKLHPVGSCMAAPPEPRGLLLLKINGSYFPLTAPSRPRFFLLAICIPITPPAPMISPPLSSAHWAAVFFFFSANGNFLISSIKARSPPFSVLLSVPRQQVADMPTFSFPPRPNPTDWDARGCRRPALPSPFGPSNKVTSLEVKQPRLPRPLTSRRCSPSSSSPLPEPSP